MNLFGFWWTSTPTDDGGKAWGWDMSYNDAIKSKVFRYDGFVSNAESVRCVRD
ncbi:MAG: hypothetical protein ABIN01_03320 [Ferruginibacter sp.]